MARASRAARVMSDRRGMARIVRGRAHRSACHSEWPGDEHRPFDRTAPAGRGLLQRAAGDLSSDDARDARLAFREEIALDPTKANAAYELAEMHRKAGEVEAARQLFEQAVTHHPAFDHALIGLARTLIALGRSEEAIPRLRAALKASPDSDVAYYQLAQAYRARGNTVEQEAALATFERLRASAGRRGASVSTRKDVTPQTLDRTPPK